ncbi:MAG TPA: YciI family protein [Myxococcota bacterium]
MKFVVLMSNDEAAWNALAPPEQARVLEAHAACERELRAGGHFLASWRLRPAAEARTVVRDAAGAIGVGNRASVGARLGGAYLIEVGSREDAERWAQRLRFIAGENEVRELWE